MAACSVADRARIRVKSRGLRASAGFGEVSRGIAVSVEATVAPEIGTNRAVARKSAATHSASAAAAKRVELRASTPL